MSTMPLYTHRYIGLRNSCWAEISVFLMVIHHEFQALLDATNDISCTRNTFQYNVRIDNPENKTLTSYRVPEKEPESALLMKLGGSLAKALRDHSVQSRNGQFANHACFAMHKSINIEIVMLQAAVNHKHSDPITTFKPDMIVILRADRNKFYKTLRKTQRFVRSQLGFRY